MRWSGNHMLNPLAAYRHGGQRYAIFAAAKLTFLAAVALLGILTILGESYLPSTYEPAIATIKVAGCLAPYLILESLYWRVCHRQNTDRGA